MVTMDFFDVPEFHGWYTLTQLHENFGIKFDGNAWYRNGDDFILVIERMGKYKAWVWVGLDPRDNMEKVLDLMEAK